MGKKSRSKKKTAAQAANVQSTPIHTSSGADEHTHSAFGGSADPPGDTTRLLSSTPRIVLADIRLGPLSPAFLYLPQGKNDIVFVDHLLNLQAIALDPLWNTPAPPMPFPAAFRVAPVPGKGLGMLATRAIKRGELIAQERPVYVTRGRVLTHRDQAHENGTFDVNAVSGLSRASRNAIGALSNAYPPAPLSGMHTLTGTLCTNLLPVSLAEETDDDNPHIACFPILARANHSCGPSAHYHFDSTSFVGQVRAVRDIAAGEEVTINYGMNLLEPRETRRMKLQAARLIRCVCEVCTLPAIDVVRSDERRRKLMHILEVLRHNMESEAFPVFLGKRFVDPVTFGELEEAMEYAKVENVFMYEAQLLVSAVFAFMDQEYPARDVMSLIERARDAATVLEGEGSDGARRLNAMLLRFTVTFATMGFPI